MLRSYSYNPFGNDGVKNPDGVRYTYKIHCDRYCSKFSEVVATQKRPKTCLDIEVPKNWKIYNLGTLAERHICPSCNSKGLK